MLPLLENGPGNKIGRTFSLPIASQARTVVNAESIPPDSPKTIFLKFVFLRFLFH